MKWIANTLRVAVVWGLVAGLAVAEEPPDAEDKAATVNDTVITKQAFEREVQIFTERMKREGRPINQLQIPVLRNEILDNMIDQELLYQESHKQKIRVEPSEVEAQYAAILQRFPNEEAFSSALEQLQMSEADVRNQIERKLAIDKLLQDQIAAKIEVSDAEIRGYYESHPDQFEKPEQVKASHILIKVDEEADEARKKAARSKIEKIRKEIAEGGDFAEMAQAHSEGPSGKRGGDLGYFSRGTMVKPFEEAAFGLKIDEVSEIVETPFGYHIIKLYDRKPSRQVGLDEAQPKIGEHLRQEKMRGEIESYLKTLEEEADIKKFI